MKFRVLRSLFAVVVVLALAACPSPSGNDADGSNAENQVVAGNGHALIDGPDFGAGSADPIELRKEIDVQLGANSDSRLSVPSTASATRFSTYSDSIYLIVPVTNVSDETLAAVRTDDMWFLDASGGKMHATARVGRIRGTVVASSFGFEHNYGLAPGETGYLIEIETNATYELTEAVTFTLTCETGYPVAGRVTPVAYEIDGDVLTGFAENTGPVRVDVYAYFYWIGFGETGAPAGCGFGRANPVPESRVVYPGETYSAEDSVSDHQGTISQVMLFFSFDSFDQDQSVAARSLAPEIEPRRADESHDEWMLRAHRAIQESRRR